MNQNQNSIGDRMEKKNNLGETRLSRGTSSPLARQTSSLFQLQQSQDCKGSTGSSGLFPMAAWVTGSSLGMSLSGAHLGVWISAGVQGCRGLDADLQSDLDTDWIW